MAKSIDLRPWQFTVRLYWLPSRSKDGIVNDKGVHEFTIVCERCQWTCPDEDGLTTVPLQVIELPRSDNAPESDNAYNAIGDGLVQLLINHRRTCPMRIDH